ncbi:hypothetical protein [Piscirickettsia salmonis]|uniref:hypothetical protein n=1 Tax=Piscirickettsia salmonis TaxID=1238 RepID=UPI0006BC3982|nr:hypothetical protein [Piscirickettsia salmonis]ALA26643.1 histidine kinase [Piscirickettsia salmonis]APS45856.1 hypothetical protein AVI48_15600 [Piscirickettsia salmonis]APS49261.1 hypothetical protein AVI49_16525 [Piscirickettsia salmonis]QGO82352.1 hypothetical protein Psal107_03403 [Piscirickettsia salmonis]QGP24181.1 hypothetical protein Psal158_03355 [Piscirickettsia salmonis]
MSTVYKKWLKPSVEIVGLFCGLLAVSIFISIGIDIAFEIVMRLLASVSDQNAQAFMNMVNLVETHSSQVILMLTVSVFFFVLATFLFVLVVSKFLNGRKA